MAAFSLPVPLSLATEKRKQLSRLPSSTCRRDGRRSRSHDQHERLEPHSFFSCLSPLPLAMSPPMRERRFLRFSRLPSRFLYRCLQQLKRGRSCAFSSSRPARHQSSAPVGLFPGPARGCPRGRESAAVHGPADKQPQCRLPGGSACGQVSLRGSPCRTRLRIGFSGNEHGGHAVFVVRWNPALGARWRGPPLEPVSSWFSSSAHAFRVHTPLSDPSQLVCPLTSASRFYIRFQPPRRPLR